VAFIVAKQCPGVSPTDIAVEIVMWSSQDFKLIEFEMFRTNMVTNRLKRINQIAIRQMKTLKAAALCSFLDETGTEDKV